MTVGVNEAEAAASGGHDRSMTGLVRGHDWSATPLGPMAGWPQSLTTIVDMMLASGHAMCLAWGPERIFLYNDAYAPLMGTRHPGAIGLAFPDAWPEIWDEIEPLVERTFAGETLTFKGLHLVMTRHGRPEDTWWDFSYSPVKDESGRVAGLLNVTLEVTDRLLAERARDTAVAQLRRNEERLRALVVASSDVLYTMSPDWTEMRQLDGRGFLADTNAPRIKWLDEYLPPEDQPAILETIAAAVRDKRIFELEHRVRRTDGTVGWTFSRSIPVLGDEGEIAEWFGMAADVTARHEATAALRESENALRQLNETLEHRVEERSRELMAAEDRVRHMQKMEAIGQLTGGVAHDFNNLLTIIRSSAELLSRRELTAEKRQKYIDAIAGTADRAAKLTGQLLAFARRQALRPEVFNVAERVGLVGDMLRSVVGARVELIVDPVRAPCFVEVDASQFETALVNLAANARDAMDGEGRLRIGIEDAARIPSLRGHAGAEGDFVRISVSDIGAGMPAEQLDHIFEPFFTTKEVGKGTGLGLSQVYGFTKQSGGEVDVASTVGAGTTFHLYLPRVHAPAATAAPSAPAPEAADGASILIVEDNEEVGEFAAQLLDDLGYTTRCAANAREAIAILERDHDAIDIVFSDVIMPGVDGVELGRQVRARWPQITIVLTSGYSHILADNARHGFDLLHKPYSVEELSRVLCEARRAG